MDSPLSPTIEVSTVETIAAGVTYHMEIVPAATISTRVTTADTPAPSGNDRKDLAEKKFIYRVSFFNSQAFFAGTLALNISSAGPSQEGATASITFDITGIDAFYCSIM